MAPKEHGVSRTTAVLVAIATFAILSIPAGAFREFFMREPLSFWIFDLFHFIVFPVLLLLWLRRAYSITPDKYGLAAVAENESWPHFIGFVLFLTVVLYFIYQAAGVFSWIIFGSPETVTFYKNMAPTGLLRGPAVAYLALTAGLFEEVFFRALPLLYLQDRFPQSLPRALYVLATSGLFGAIHWANGAHEVLATFIFGVFAALFYLKLRDLWPLVGAHALSDAWDFW